MNFFLVIFYYPAILIVNEKWIEVYVAGPVNRFLAKIFKKICCCCCKKKGGDKIEALDDNSATKKPADSE